MRSLRWLTIAALMSGACFRYTPPQPVPARAPVPIAAPFDSTWSAVISFFAENDISIKTLEKASGFIVAERAGFNMSNRAPLLDKKGRQKKNQYGAPMVGDAIYADCGVKGPVAIDPYGTTFNVHVQGTGAASTIQINMFFYAMQGTTDLAEPARCVTKGKWEQALEASVRRRLKLPVSD